MPRALQNTMQGTENSESPAYRVRRRSSSTTSLMSVSRLPPPTDDVLRGPEMFKVIRKKSEERKRADNDRRSAIPRGYKRTERSHSSKNSGTLSRSVARLGRSRSITHSKKMSLRSSQVSAAERAYLTSLAEEAMAEASSEPPSPIPMTALKKREERAKLHVARDVLQGDVDGDCPLQAVVKRKRSTSADVALPRILAEFDDDEKLKQEVEQSADMAEEPAKGGVLSNLRSKLGLRRSKPRSKSSLSESMELPRSGSFNGVESAKKEPIVKSTSTSEIANSSNGLPGSLSSRDSGALKAKRRHTGTSKLASTDDQKPKKADDDEEQLKTIQEAQVRTQMRNKGLPPSLLKSLALRAGSLTHRSSEDVLDRFARFRSMSTHDVVRLIIAGADSLQNVACECLNSTETASTMKGVSPALQKLVIRLYHYLSFVVETSCNEDAKAFECGKHIIGILRDTTASEVVGEANEEMLDAITGERAAITTSVCNIIKGEAKDCLADLVASAICFSHTYCLYSEQKKAGKTDDAEEYSLILVYAARGIVDAIGQILDYLSMLDSLLVSLELRAADSYRKVTKSLSKERDDVNVYDEMLHDHEENSAMCSCHLPEGAATINSIVCNITDPTGNHSLNYVKMIILTLHAFTTPWDLFAKLKERYFVPEGIASAYAIGLKVGVVLKQWIGLRFRDLDEELQSEMRKFLSEDMIETHKEMAVHLLQALESEGASSRNFAIQLCEPHSRVEIKEVMGSQWDVTGLFSDFTSLQIAEQLTLVDRDIFRTIDVKGLIGQAWNKVSQRHVAQSVVNVLHRLNSMAAWVASVILSKKSLSRRIKVLTKLVKVCDALRKMRNFMGLAGIIFGMSQVSVNRLKFTFAGLAKSTKKMLIGLQELMDPLSSYKQYRQALASAPPPVIPFLGVKLSDLTMIDEGNPTFVKTDVEDSLPLVNIKKQEMVYACISEILMFKQSCEYDIKPDSRLASYCRHLPLICSEDELYYLSCSREPPQATAADIK